MAVAKIDPFWNDIIAAVDFVGHFAHLEEVTVERNGRKAAITLDQTTNQIVVVIADSQEVAIFDHAAV
jgi:hypothetical protein